MTNSENESKNFFISDMHFGHKNILGYDNRPFFTLKEMEEALINNWNSVVSDSDTVYVLGDMFWIKEDAKRILPQLKGKKILILGNHDTVNADMRKHFQHIKDYMEIEEDNKHIILSHYPIPFFKKLTRDNYYMLYGHVHNSWDYNMIQHLKKEIEGLYQTTCHLYNVGCMLSYMNYTPRTLDEIVAANKESK